MLFSRSLHKRNGLIKKGSIFLTEKICTDNVNVNLKFIGLFLRLTLMLNDSTVSIKTPEIKKLLTTGLLIDINPVFVLPYVSNVCMYLK